jgi:hypothetical protein
MGRFFRVVGGVAIQFISWFAIATLCFIAAGIYWPAFAAANSTFNATQLVTFDQPMMISRIGLTFAASILASWIAALTVRDNRLTPVLGGFVLLALFVPNHIMLWDKFPLWYHLSFLTSLPVLAFIGGRLAPSR